MYATDGTWPGPSEEHLRNLLKLAMNACEIGFDGAWRFQRLARFARSEELLDAIGEGATLVGAFDSQLDLVIANARNRLTADSGIR